MVKGKVFYADEIKCMDVPLNAPNGEALLADPVRFVVSNTSLTSRSNRARTVSLLDLMDAERVLFTESLLSSGP